MAISWGTTNGHLRVGIDVSQSPSSVSQGTSSVTLTVQYYVQSVSWGFSDNQTLNLSGDASGSFDYFMSSPNNSTVTKYVGQRQVTVPTSYTGTVSRSFTAKVSGAFNGASPSKTRSHSVAKRPSQSPATPTAANVARSSDSQQNVSWSNTSPSSSSAPYTGLHIDRWDIASGNYKRVATVSTRTSWSDKTTSANQQYRYRIRAYNGSGTSGWDYTPYISTTPAAPTSLKAVKTAGGDIKLTWSLAGVRKCNGVEVWLTKDGVDMGSRHVLISGRPASWTHVDPDPGSTWQYRLKAMVESTGSTEADYTIYGPFSGRSNTVQLLARPAKPTGLSPSGVTRDGSQNIVLSWDHNAVDATEQRKFQVAHRVVGAPAYTYTGEITSGVSSWTLPADAYSNGDQIEWAVQTWGQYADPSVYGYSSPLTLSTPPTASITSPAESEVVETPTIVIRWEYYDAESNPQTQYIASLYDQGGNRLERISFYGSGTFRTMTTVLADAGTYIAGVQVRDSTGLLSVEDRTTFTVEYATPPTPAITTQWVPESGAVVIAVNNPVPDDGQVTAVSNSIWHSTNGEDWALVGLIPENGSITDYLPNIHGLNYYKVEAWSDLPSAATATATVVTDEENRIWLNAGPGFGLAVPLVYNPGIGIDTGRDKTLHKFAGRTKPVAFTGEHTSKTIALDALLIDYAPEDVEDLVLAHGTACYRDPSGRRIFVSIENAGFTHKRSNMWTMTASLTEVDR